MSLYESGWTPRGVRKSWERNSISNATAEKAFGLYGRVPITDACAWFDERDNLRVIVADTAAGRRLTYRNTARGVSITSEPRP